MLFLGVGVLFLILKWAEIGPVALWDWWMVLLPFALAVGWWTWADLSGYTSRRAMDREDQRKQARIDKSRAAMGHGPRKRP